MTVTHRFANYIPAYRMACLALFDANCPDFFAQNERADYEAFLDQIVTGYFVCIMDDSVVGAFGMSEVEVAERRRLTWIMLAAAAQGSGIGRTMVAEVMAAARSTGASALDIAASHRSASFFARFGAREIRRIENGWGTGMHRIDMEILL